MKTRQIVTGFIVFFSLFPQFSTLTSGITQELNTNINVQFGEIINKFDNDTTVINTTKSTVLIREYWAVLIGLNNYPGSSNDLPWSVNELTCFKNTLLSSGNWKEDHIKMLTDDTATKENISNATEWLDQHEDSNDVSIFYFVGHGSTNLTNQDIIVYDSSISDEELKNTCDTLEGHVIVILDSCYSGGFIEELKDRKRVILTACEKDQLTYQDSNLRSGFFGYFINLTLSQKTKTAELTFLFAYPLIISYSKKVSEEYGENYTVTPQMYDGSIFLTKVIRSHLRGMIPHIIDTADIHFTASWKVWRM